MKHLPLKNAEQNDYNVGVSSEGVLLFDFVQDSVLSAGQNPDFRKMRKVRMR